MKKNYISPKVDIYEVKVSNLLSGSPGLNPEKTVGEGLSGDPVNFGRDDDNDW